eukprot:739945-Prorocentrum_minimum.AAC.1
MRSSRAIGRCLRPPLGVHGHLLHGGADVGGGKTHGTSKPQQRLRCGQTVRQPRGHGAQHRLPRISRGAIRTYSQPSILAIALRSYGGWNPTVPPTCKRPAPDSNLTILPGVDPTVPPTCERPCPAPDWFSGRSPRRPTRSG